MSPLQIRLLAEYTAGVVRARNEYALNPFAQQGWTGGASPTARRVVPPLAAGTPENGDTTEAVPSGVGSTSGDLTTALDYREGGGC